MTKKFYYQIAFDTMPDATAGMVISIPGRNMMETSFRYVEWCEAHPQYKNVEIVKVWERIPADFEIENQLAIFRKSKKETA